MQILIDFSRLVPPEPRLQDPAVSGLQWLAGNTVVGHMLAELPDSDVIIVSNGDAAAVARWLSVWDATLAVRPLDIVPDGGWQDVLPALRSLLDGDAEGVLYLRGDRITQADFAGLAAKSTADVILIEGDQQVGACWFRTDADFLEAAPNLMASTDAADLAERLSGRGRRSARQEAAFCLDINSAMGLLAANARLLALGRGSEDAVERGYAEDFTVIPPVFLHETAVVEYAVIGPHVHIDAGAVVRNSVVRNALIGVEGRVVNAALDGAIVGDQAQIVGQTVSGVTGAGEGRGPQAAQGTS